jgi:hypothetical protein
MIRMIGRHVLTALILTTLSVSPAAFAQTERGTGKAVVTIEGAKAPVTRESVHLSIREGDAQIADFVPLRGDRAGLQLLILIDDSARRSLSLQYNDIKTLIMSLPETAQVGVAYMQNGSARFAQAFTSNHAAAAAALRIPSGSAGSNGSPYFVLSELAKNWSSPEQKGNAIPLRPGAVRREVLMFTNGVEPYASGAFDPQNPYVQSAINDSQRAGVIVYAIYVRDVGLGGQGDAEAYNGQNYLEQLTSATGGKAYYIGTNSSPDFRPYLDDLKQKLNNQYELDFIANLKRRTDSVGIKVQVDGAKAYAPSRVYLTQAPQ